MLPHNQEEYDRIMREKEEKLERELEAKAEYEKDSFYRDSFLQELKIARLITVIKLILILAIFGGIAIFVSKSFIVPLILIALFLIIKKFVRFGNSVIYESFNQFSGTYELTDMGFIGFLIGLVVVYAAMIGLQKLAEYLFPPYFFIFEFIVVAILFIWLVGPVLSDIYFVIKASVMIKNPPETSYFSLSEYMAKGKVGKLQKVVGKLLLISVCTIIIGALVGQTVQYLIESPKLLAELDREAAFAAYQKEHTVVGIPKEEFEKPDNRDYKRFKAKCIDTYIYDVDNSGVKTKNTVTVTYNYKSEWVVDKYTIETKLLSINTAGTWTGYGDDHYYLGDFDDDFFTLEIDKLTDREASGRFTCLPPGENNEENQFNCNFTGTVELQTEFDENDNQQYYYVITATTDVPRGWGDDVTIIFTYHVGTDTITVSNNYDAVLKRAS